MSFWFLALSACKSEGGDQGTRRAATRPIRFARGPFRFSLANLAVGMEGRYKSHTAGLAPSCIPVCLFASSWHEKGMKGSSMVANVCVELI